MPAFVKPQCYVRLSGVDYKIRRGGLDMYYMPNGWQVAKAIIDLNESSPPNVNLFTGEAAVDVKIENVTMMTGYVVTPKRICEPLTQRSPGKKLGLELLIADKVGYLTKGEFSNDYFRSKTIQRLLQDLAGTLGVSHSISASLSNTFKRSFFGTMGKDAAAFSVEKGADWFGDESGVLNAWPQSSPPALTTGGLTYQVQDFTSGGSHQIEISHLHPYYYIPDDALQRYRNAKLMNSNRETFPEDMDQITNSVFWNGTLGYNYARWISGIEINGMPNKCRAAKLEPGPPIGGGTNNGLAPAISFSSGHTSDRLVAQFWYVADDSGMSSSGFFKMPMNSFDQLWFHIWTDINMANASEIALQVLDNTTPGSAFYTRDIKPDINAASAWSFLLYPLPTATSGANGLISNGWTKVGAGNFNQIDAVFIGFFRAASGTTTGWPVNSTIKFATFFFVRRVSATASGAATGLNLTKPVINDSTQDIADLQDQANKELARIAYAVKAGCTCPGHTDFKRPGYQMNVNFNQTWGSGHSGSPRLEKARHYTDIHGFYWMELEFGPALQRL